MLNKKINSQKEILSSDPELSILKTSRLEIVDVHRKNGQNIFEIFEKMNLKKDLYVKKASKSVRVHDYLKEKEANDDYDSSFGHTLGQTLVVNDSHSLAPFPCFYVFLFFCMSLFQA